MNGLIRLRTKRTNDYIPLMKVMVSTASEEPDSRRRARGGASG